MDIVGLIKADAGNLSMIIIIQTQMLTYSLVWRRTLFAPQEVMQQL